MSNQNNNCHGFTLLELLVSMTVGSVILGLAVGSYQHSQKLIRRADALLRLHRIAGDIGEQWDKDADYLMQSVACNTTTTYAAGLKTMVQFTGMRTIQHNFNNMLYDYPHDTDLAWFRWEWNAKDHRLTRAQSPPPHWITWYPGRYFSYFDTHEINSGQHNIPTRPLFGMRPNPVANYSEAFATSPPSVDTGYKKWFNPTAPIVSTIEKTRIFDQLFLTGIDVDGVTRTYGTVAGTGIDLEMNSNANSKIPNPNASGASGGTGPTYGGDLSADDWKTLPVPDPRRPLADDISDCSITVVTRDGNVHQDPGTGVNHSIVGESHSGSDAAAGARPKLLRIAFTLTDRLTGLTQSFTFTSKAP